MDDNDIRSWNDSCGHLFLEAFSFSWVQNADEDNADNNSYDANCQD